MENAERMLEETRDSNHAGADDEPAKGIGGLSDSAGKIDMTYHTYVSYYSGYLDHVALFGTMYDNCDYDGDGLTDRIFRNVFDADENGDVCSYRIDLGNGETLMIGNFGDYYTGIQLTGYDLTGDGINEIVFCGEHTACTFLKSMSEIAVFEKTDDGYEMLGLPRPDDWDASKASEKYRVGCSIYIKNIVGNMVTICRPDLDYEETVVVEEKTALDYFRLAGALETVGSDAWYIDVSDYHGTPALRLSINIGSRYYERDLSVYLIWQDKALQPVNMRFEETAKNLPEQIVGDGQV